jgi:nickel-dependent lactate racemase
MKVELQYGLEQISLEVPEDSFVYKSKYKKSAKSASDLMMESIAKPFDSRHFSDRLQNRKKGDVVIVVSDITRPIPYSEFLPQMIDVIILQNGVAKSEITILIATGMHRASTSSERRRMFGEFIVSNYRIIDHNCEKDDELEKLDGLSWSGSEVRLNKHYVRAGFRIVTGLVEPHFMAGFSGGRKAICPGLVSLESIRKFHGYDFLSHPNAAGGVMKDNPCHLENTSVAKLCPPDFAVNIVLDDQKKVNAVISGELSSSHIKAVDYVRSACCPVVERQAEVAVTSCGGYPLDATFYQCVKGFVNCLPAVKTRGEIISFGSCMDGIGSPEYTALMKEYSGKHLEFIEYIKNSGTFIKDQWEFQMHIRALDRVSVENLHFYTSIIPQPELALLSVQPHSLPVSQIADSIQKQIDQAVKAKKQLAVFPEGPYCSPIN